MHRPSVARMEKVMMNEEETKSKIQHGSDCVGPRRFCFTALGFTLG